MDFREVVSFSRIDGDSIVLEYPLSVFPSLDSGKVVGSDNKREVIFRLPGLQGVESTYRIVWGFHPEFYVVHPDMQVGMPLDSFDCGFIPCFSGVGRDIVLERVLRGHDQVYPVKIFLPRQVFHDGLMSDVERVERSRIYRYFHDLAILGNCRRSPPLRGRLSGGHR